MNPHFTAAWRAVAIGKIEAFACECERLAELADRGEVNRSEAASELHDIALANCLTTTFGDTVAEMISTAFAPEQLAEAAE